MLPNEIFDKLKIESGEEIISLNEDPGYEPSIKVEPTNLVDIMLFLRDEEGLEFDYPSCLSGVDLGANLGVVYNLYSMKRGHKITIKVEVPKEAPDVPSCELVWRSFDWHEREAYDLLGINFVGHHNLTRILLPDDWEGHPLRKDYVQPDYFHGMKVPY
ncbi:MAG TPA: NADH-quinone oxidoreductase subunit C [Bacteroidetes bacterium]|nr:NADH-quinone oxidoreductase subunit C [Bacteroidota bacterium]